MFDITQGVTFGTYHTYTDWGLVLESDEIKFPQAKGNIDDLPIYGQADLDPRVTWGRRELTFTFGVARLQQKWPALVQTITSAIQGKKLQIVRDREPDVMYIGRCRVESFNTQLSIGHFVIAVDAEPFKVDISPTQYTFTGTRTLSFNYNGSVMTPAKITVTPTGGLTTLTIDNATRNPNTLISKQIKVMGLTPGNVLVIDGIEQTIKVGNENKFQDTELWYWPTVIPGANVITLNTEAQSTTIEVRRRYI